jgi:thymidylate synthase (FAD)
MKNNVTLIGHYGNDTIIACSAWTSTSRELTEEKKNRIPALINMLWKDGHETPFEKGSVHFLVDCDIASHIHLLKHRIASVNAESARYKELKEDKYYVPEDWNNIKLSENSLTHKMDREIWGNDWMSVIRKHSEISNQLYHQCLEDLTPILGRKRAKESARYFKTYNSQIQSDVQFNMRSFANFLKLRNSENSQLEIREIAQQMLELVQNIEENPFEHTLKAFGYEE